MSVNILPSLCSAAWFLGLIDMCTGLHMDIKWSCLVVFWEQRNKCQWISCYWHPGPVGTLAAPHVSIHFGSDWEEKRPANSHQILGVIFAFAFPLFTRTNEMQTPSTHNGHTHQILSRDTFHSLSSFLSLPSYSTSSHTSYSIPCSFLCNKFGKILHIFHKFYQTALHVFQRKQRVSVITPHAENLPSRIIQVHLFQEVSFVMVFMKLLQSNHLFGGSCRH